MGRPAVWTWEPSCNPNERLFEFIDGGPDKNGFLYCPYCGRPLVEAEPAVEDEDK